MKRIAVVFSVLLFFVAVPAFGQAPTASITGAVLDHSGAAIAGARIVATDIDTGVTHRTLSDQTGNYTLPSLPVGRYSVHVDATGFSTIDRTGLTLVIDQVARLDFTLRVGAVSQVVTVNANATQLETEQHSLGTVLNERQISQLPLNSRSFYTLAYLVPGVSPSADNSALGFRGGFDVAGAQEDSNNFMLDGFENNELQLGIPSFRPSVDAIQEFKVLTGLYGAQYGGDDGGQVVVTGKSGTNQFHGLLYEYLRNQVFDAKNYFDRTAKPDFKRSQFGGTLGGPIIRNKTFFFVNYEGLQFHQQVSALATVPTPAMLTGDFSSLPSSIQLKDPFTGAPVAGNNIATLPEWTTQAAIIGQALASYYPSPSTLTPAGSKPSNNYNFSALRPESANQFGVRIDQNFSASDSLYAEGNYYRDTSLEPHNTLCGNRTLPGFGCDSGFTSTLDGISETHIFSPRLLNTFRMAFNRDEQTRLGQDRNVNFISQYNIPNVFFNSPPSNGGLPQVSVAGYSVMGSPVNNPQDFVDNNFEWGDQLIWARGRQTLAFGADIRRDQDNYLDLLRSRGIFSFTASNGTPTTGYPLADLLLGLPSSATGEPYGPKVYDRTTAINAFVEDDWKVSPRLTLNLGLRWELQMPFTALHNQASTFVPALGQVVLAGTNGYGSNLIQYDYKLFEPRVGFAYSLSSKTVLRGGYGIYGNTTSTVAGFAGFFINPPMRVLEAVNSSIANPVLLSHPFPVTPASGTSTPNGIDYHWLTGYIQQYGLGVERQLSPNTLFGIDYFGSKGLHLPRVYNINQPPAQSAITSVSGVNALRPFPTFGNITWMDSEGISNYNSMQVKFQQRYSHGLTFLASYTYGRSLDNTIGVGGTAASSAPQDSYNLRAEYGPSDFNNQQRMTLSGVYELPFGRTRTWLKTGVPSLLAGGWQLSGIFSQFSGRPFTLYYSSNISNTFNFEDRPNIVGNPNAGPKSPTDWLNTTAIVTPPLGTFGNEGRNSMVGPGYADLDATLARVFAVRDRMRIEFRAEVFNLLNHPNFNLPNSTVDGGGFNTIGTAQDPREIQFALRLSF